MSAKSIRFSQTVSTKQFGSRLAMLLNEQYEDSNLPNKLLEVKICLEDEDYELSLLHLNRLRQEIEAFLVAIDDTQQNVSSFIQLNSEQTKQTEEEPVEKEAEVVKEQPTQDSLQQLQQIEKLVNVVKSLKGESA
jgi:hypothetical protein